MPLIRKEPAAPAATTTPSGKLLVGANAEQRWSAARAMSGDANAVGALSAALLSEADARVREAILTSLATTDTSAAVDAVLPHLRSDDASLRTGALDSLRAMRTAVVPRVRELLEDSDPDVRVLACELVRQVPQPQASELLGHVILNDPEVNVCAAAVETLAEIGGSADMAALTECAARFPGEIFLRFSIDVTLERISVGAASPRG